VHVIERQSLQVVKLETVAVSDQFFGVHIVVDSKGNLFIRNLGGAP
jgi:hypothetical protein